MMERLGTAAKLGGTRRSWGGWLRLAAGAALLSSCSSVEIETAAAPGCSGEDLSTLDDYQLGDIANSCRAAAQDSRASNLQAAVANYRAGQAWRAQGELRNGVVSPEPPRAPVWLSASAALEAALANLNPPPQSENPTGQALLMEETWVGAKLELARVRAYMWDWDVALQHATDVYQRYTNGRQISAVYERARISLLRFRQDPNPAYRERAFDDLSRLSSPQYDTHANAQEARQEVTNLAQALGDRALGELNLERARSFFAAGKEAAEAMRRVGGGAREAEIAAFNLGLGKVEVLRAGLGGPDEVGGCEARPIYPAALEAAVRDNLDAAARDPEAHRWAGCALLALDQLGPAIARFRTAAASPAGRVNAATQLSLARALRDAARNEIGGRQSLDYRAQSLSAYADAITLLPEETERDRRAIVLVETANTLIEYNRAAPSTELPPACAARISDASASDPLTRSDSPALACAVSMLREATGFAPDNAAAFLSLGVLYADMIGPTPSGARLDRVFTAAFTSLDDAVRKSGASSELRAEASSSLSRVAEEGWQRGYRTSPARRPSGSARNLSVIAIESADEAARLSTEKYASQACLARIYFGQTAELRRTLARYLAEGGRYCETDANEPVALLYEGMFHLRETYRLSGLAQSGAWESALEAFQAGVREVDARGPSMPNQAQLRGRLLAGQGYAYTCAGFRNAGEAILRDIPNDAEEYYIRYGFQRCAPRRN